MDFQKYKGLIKTDPYKEITKVEQKLQNKKFILYSLLFNDSILFAYYYSSY